MSSRLGCKAGCRLLPEMLPGGSSRLQSNESQHILDTMCDLADQGKLAIYGDATGQDILEVAGIHVAKYLLMTTPHVPVRTLVILGAREVNPELGV